MFNTLLALGRIGLLMLTVPLWILLAVLGAAMLFVLAVVMLVVGGVGGGRRVFKIWQRRAARAWRKGGTGTRPG